MEYYSAPNDFRNYLMHKATTKRVGEWHDFNNRRFDNEKSDYGGGRNTKYMKYLTKIGVDSKIINALVRGEYVPAQEKLIYDTMNSGMSDYAAKSRINSQWSKVGPAPR